jgi:very-short-patch-repair endonuclease|tara:strand:+ start:4389 stop:4688 length:300 start_codon:yes stop_codon:yes gene_type:complete
MAAQSQLKSNKLPSFDIEYRFHPVRRWRFDFAWVEQKVALEIEGGVWSGGRHTNPKGFINDCEKYNSAIVLGWHVLRCTSLHIKSGQMIDWVKALLPVK